MLKYKFENLSGPETFLQWSSLLAAIFSTVKLLFSFPWPYAEKHGPGLQ